MTAATPRSKLVVGIDARIVHGHTGGVESVIIGLAQGLSSLDGDETYVFLAIEGLDDWIRPYVRGNARVLTVPDRRGPGSPRFRAWVKRSIPGVAWLRRRIPRENPWKGGPPQSDGTIERHGIHLMHFTWQRGFFTSLPSIYHPHDLQYRHLPALFPPGELAYRDSWYVPLSARASMVAVASSWIRDDVIKEFALPEDKVRVIPFAPPIQAVGPVTSARIAEIKESRVLPDRFIFYPAQTWKHKNHIGLVTALSLIRRRWGIVIPAVLTGRRNEFAASIDRKSVV